MRPIFSVLTPNATEDLAAIFSPQTTPGAQDLTLDGNEVANGEWEATDGLAKKVSVTSAANVATVVFTFTGFEDFERTRPITDTITGVNANTVFSTQYFAIVTSVSVDSALASPANGGNSTESTSPIYVMNWRGQVAGITIQPSGTINYTVQQTQDNIQNTSPPFQWFDDTDSNLVNVTVTRDRVYQAIPIALRVIINSVSGNASLKVTITHTDTY